MRTAKAILLSLLLSGCSPAYASNFKHLSFDELVCLIAKAESNWNELAIGPGGERGLMQLDRHTWQELTDLPYSKAWDGATSLQVGGKLVALIEEKFHTTNPAYVCFRYNLGMYSRITFADWKRINKNKIYRSLY